MKRIISILLCLVLILAFAGCKDNDEILLSSEASSIVEDTVSDSSDVLPSTPSQQETPSSNITSSNNESTSTPVNSSSSNESTSTPVNSSSSNESTSTPVNSSSNDTTTTTPSKPQQTVVDDPNTITAPNGDKIKIDLTNGKNPSVSVKVNGKEIYSYNNFKKYKDEYDFSKDFTLDVKKEYSDDQILWAYKFDWGVVYAAPYENEIVYVAGAKHEHAKKTYGTYQYYHLALEMDLIDYKIMEYTGEKYYWENLPLAQSFTEYFYKTEDYELKEIEDLTKAGYDFKEYYDWHNLEFNKRIGAIYELYISGEKKALMYISAGEGRYEIQEFGWDRIKKIWVSAGNPHMNAEFR